MQVRHEGNTPKRAVAWLRLSEVPKTRPEVEDDRIAAGHFERDARRVAAVPSC
jgi:hypothetical protein